MNATIFYVILNLLLPPTASTDEVACKERQELSCDTVIMHSGDVGTTPPDDGETETAKEGN